MTPGQRLPSEEEIGQAEALLVALSARGVGHTRAMLSGAEASRCRVVFASLLAGHRELPHKRLSVLSLDQIPTMLQGYRGPVLIDHHALCQILSPLLHAAREAARLRKLVEEAPHENTCHTGRNGFFTGSCDCWKARAEGGA